MIARNTIENGIYDFIAAICTHQNLTFSIQWANDNANKSVVPRIELKIISIASVGSPVSKPNNYGIITFAGNLVAGNVINLKVNGSAISPVTFLTDNATTMGLIASAIALKTTYVTSCAVTAAREITVNGVDGTDVLITNIVVTAGATQTTGSFATVYGITELRQDAILVLRVIASGAYSLPFITLFKMVSLVPSLADSLRSSTGLAILKTTEPMNISSFNDQFVEERWTCEISFSFAYSLERVDVGLIEDVELVGTLVSDSGVTKTITVTIDI